MESLATTFISETRSSRLQLTAITIELQHTDKTREIWHLRLGELVAMDINARKEQFSRAYVQAVAAVAGYCYSKPEVDDDSIDLTLAQRGGGGTVRSPKLDLQLKCHAAIAPNDDHFSFALKRKNYDDLRGTSFQVPRILVVVLVPTVEFDWLVHSESELSIRRSGYWVSIRGLPDSQNTESVTIQVPRSQPFHPKGLKAIMDRIGTGELP